MGVGSGARGKFLTCFEVIFIFIFIEGDVHEASSQAVVREDQEDHF